MSNVDFDSIQPGTQLIVLPYGGDESTYEVEVEDIYTILTKGGEETTAYIVSPTKSLSKAYIVGDGEIVSIVNG